MGGFGISTYIAAREYDRLMSVHHDTHSGDMIEKGMEIFSDMSKFNNGRLTGVRYQFDDYSDKYILPMVLKND